MAMVDTPTQGCGQHAGELKYGFTFTTPICGEVCHLIGQAMWEYLLSDAVSRGCARNGT